MGEGSDMERERDGWREGEGERELAERERAMKTTLHDHYNNSTVITKSKFACTVRPRKNETENYRCFIIT